MATSWFVFDTTVSMTTPGGNGSYGTWLSGKAALIGAIEATRKKLAKRSDKQAAKSARSAKFLRDDN
jgi:hypothetical protein